MGAQKANLTITKVSRWWEVQYNKRLVKHFTTKEAAEAFVGQYKYDDIRNILKSIGKEQIIRRSPKSGGWINRMGKG